MSHSIPFQKNTPLTEGSVQSHLIRMTVPMIWGILATISFQLVDTYYVSLLGTDYLAAISYTFPVTYGIFSIFIGLGVATSSVLSRLIGENNHDTVKRVSAHGMIVVFAISIFISLFGLLLINPIFHAMNADDLSLSLIRVFMVPYLLGTFFLGMPVINNATLRAAGDTKTPALIMCSAAVFNIILDPILIFGLFQFPRMELLGAALSTLIANIGAFTVGIFIIYRRNLLDLQHLKTFLGFGNSAKRLLIIGVPVALTSMLPSFLNSTINHILTESGKEAVAAFGAASRIEAFTLVIMMALSIGMAPIIGQNWGARKFDRVHDTIKKALIFSVIWAVFVAVVLGGFSSQLSTLFSDDADLKKYLILYLIIVPLSYPLGNLTHGWGSVFNAIGKPQISASVLFFKMIVIMIPACFIGYHYYGVQGLFIAIASVNVISGLGFHLWAKHKISQISQA